MGEFGDMMKRREVIEDALAEALKSCGEIMHNADGERCFAALVSTGEYTSEWQLTSLWKLACQIEARLS